MLVVLLCDVENLVGNHFCKYQPVDTLQFALGIVYDAAYHCAYASAPFGERYTKGFKFMATET